MNIPLNEKEYSELIKLIYWAVLEENINYNDDFKSMCNAVRTADGSTLEELYLLDDIINSLKNKIPIDVNSDMTEKLSLIQAKVLILTAQP